LNDKLRQFEDIIRSKDRIDAEHLRDSLREEVLNGAMPGTTAGTRR
jgi:hypothetical protein